MNKIPQHIIDQVRDTAEIYDIVSEYVDLKQRGNNFFGLCPFHNEKTPSFSISPEKEIFHCFGCGAGGNSITFLMDYEKISFIEALEKIVTNNKQQLPNINIYQAVISDVDDEEITFNITKNDITGDSQSSSILDFGFV